jgi:hypothetical protein
MPRLAGVTTRWPRSVLTRNLVIVGCACVVLHACGLMADACKLEVSKDTGAGLEAITPPYVVTLPLPGASDHLAISLSGSGWLDARLVVIGPTGFLEEDSPGLEEYLNGTRVSFTVDKPGRWRVRITDPVAGCDRGFTVEVMPPNPP